MNVRHRESSSQFLFQMFVKFTHRQVLIVSDDYPEALLKRKSNLFSNLNGPSVFVCFHFNIMNFFKSE